MKGNSIMSYRMAEIELKPMRATLRMKRDVIPVIRRASGNALYTKAGPLYRYAVKLTSLRPYLLTCGDASCRGHLELWLDADKAIEAGLEDVSEADVEFEAEMFRQSARTVVAEYATVLKVTNGEHTCVKVYRDDPLPPPGDLLDERGYRRLVGQSQEQTRIDQAMSESVPTWNDDEPF